MADSAFVKQLQGYSIVTANITYRMPDYRHLLQEFIWQQYDLAPGFPELKKFLGFWEEKIEGPIYSVTVAHARLISPAEIRMAGEFRLN